jgi:hypothetical protein
MQNLFDDNRNVGDHLDRTIGKIKQLSPPAAPRPTCLRHFELPQPPVTKGSHNGEFLHATSRDFECKASPHQGGAHAFAFLPSVGAA